METENTAELSDYELGYNDGNEGKRVDMYLSGNEDYMTGYTDGEGQRELDGLQNNYRPVDEEYALLGDPPAGFNWAYDKRTPEPGDYYLSKGGNANLAKKVRGNAQTRHILIPEGKCNCHKGGGGWGHVSWCPVHANVKGF